MEVEQTHLGLVEVSLTHRSRMHRDEVSCEVKLGFTHLGQEPTGLRR